MPEDAMAQVTAKDKAAAHLAVLVNVVMQAERDEGECGLAVGICHGERGNLLGLEGNEQIFSTNDSPVSNLPLQFVRRNLVNRAVFGRRIDDAQAASLLCVLGHHQ